MDDIKIKGNSFESKKIKSPYTLIGSTSIGQTFLEDRSLTRNICYKQKPSNLNKSFLPSTSSCNKKNNFSSVPKGIKHLKSNMCNYYKKNSKKKQKNRSIKSDNQYTGNDTHSKYQENFLPYTNNTKTGSSDQTFIKKSRHKKKKKNKAYLPIVQSPIRNVLENSTKTNAQVKDCNSKLIPEEERQDNELFFFDISGNIRNTHMHNNTEYDTFGNERKNCGLKKKNKKNSFRKRKSGTATIEKAIIKNSSNDSNQNRPSEAKINNTSKYCVPKSENNLKESDLGLSPSMNSKTMKLHKWEEMLIDIRDSDCEVTSFHESVSKKKKKKENKIHESEVENDTEVESIRKSRDRRNSSDSYCEQLNVYDHSMPKVKKKQHEVLLGSNNSLSKASSLNSNIKINKTELKPSSEKQNEEMASCIKDCDLTADNLSPLLKGKNKKSAHTDKLLDILLRESNRYSNSDMSSANESNNLRKLNTMLSEIVKDTDCEALDVSNSTSSSKKKQEHTKRLSLSLNTEHTVKTYGKTLKNNDNFVIINDSDNEIMSKSQKKKKMNNKSLGRRENFETIVDTDSKKKHDSSKDYIFDYLKLSRQCSDNDDQVIADTFKDEDNIVSITNSSFKKKKKRKPNTNESADTNRTLSKSELNKSQESVLLVDSFEDKLNNVDNKSKDDEKIRISDVNSSLFKKERRRSQHNKSFGTGTISVLNTNHETTSKNYRDRNDAEIIIEDAVDEDIEVVSINDSSTFKSKKRKKKKKYKPIENDSVHTNIESTSYMEHGIFGSSSIKDNLAAELDNKGKITGMFSISDDDSYLFTKKKKRKKQRENKDIDGNDIKAIVTSDSSFQSKKGHKHLQANAADEITEKTPKKEHKSLAKDVTFIDSSIENFVELNSVKSEADNFNDISSLKKKKKKRQKNESSEVNTSKMDHQISLDNDLEDVNFVEAEKPRKFKKERIDSVDVVSNFNNKNYDNEICMLNNSDIRLSKKKKKKKQKENELFEASIESTSDRKSPTSEGNDFKSISRCRDNNNYSEIVIVKGDEYSKSIIDDSVVKIKKENKQIEADLVYISSGKRLKKKHKKDSESVTFVDSLEEDFYRSINTEDEVVALSDASSPLKKKKKKHQEHESFEVKSENTSKKRRKISIGSDLEGINGRNDAHISFANDQDDGDGTVNTNSFSIKNKKKNKQTEGFSVDNVTKDKPKKKSGAVSDDVVFIDNFEENLDTINNKVSEIEEVAQVDSSSPSKKKRKKHRVSESFEENIEGTFKRKRQNSVGVPLEDLNEREILITIDKDEDTDRFTINEPSVKNKKRSKHNESQVLVSDDQRDSAKNGSVNQSPVKTKKTNKRARSASADIIAEENWKKHETISEDATFVGNLEEHLGDFKNKIHDDERVRLKKGGSVSKRKIHQENEPVEVNTEGTFQTKFQNFVGVKLGDVSEDDILNTDDKDEDTNRFTINEPSVKNKKRSKHNESQVLVSNDQRDSAKNASVNESTVKTKKTNKRARSASADIIAEENWKKHETISEDATFVGNLEEHLGDFNNKIHHDERVRLKKGSSLSKKKIHQENESESDTELKIDIKYDNIDYSLSTKNKKKNEEIKADSADVENLEETRNEKSAINTPEKKSKKWKVEDFLLDQGNTSNTECELNDMINEQSFISEDIISDSDSDGISDFALFKMRKKESTLENGAELFETLNGEDSCNQIKQTENIQTAHSEIRADKLNNKINSTSTGKGKSNQGLLGNNTVGSEKGPHTKKNSYVGEAYASSSEGYKSDSSEILSPEKQKQSGDNYKNDTNRDISCTAAPCSSKTRKKNLKESSIADIENISEISGGLKKKQRGRKTKEEGIEIKENGKVNNNEKSGILHGLPLVDCSDVEDDIEKLKNTTVMLPFAVPPLHSILTRSTLPSKSQLDEIKDRNIEVKTGLFSKEEDEQIIANWKEFCKEHELRMIPSLFVTLPRKMPVAERINFLRYLAHGLDNRMLHRVHARFKLIVGKLTKKEGKFTPEEDTTILKHLIKTRSYRPNRELSVILNRPTLSIEKRLRRLHAKNQSTITWNQKLIDKLVRHMKKITKCEDVAELEHRTITIKEWKMISKEMNDIPIHKLQRGWQVSVYPRLFAKANIDLRKIKYKIIEMLPQEYQTPKLAKHLLKSQNESIGIDDMNENLVSDDDDDSIQEINDRDILDPDDDDEKNDSHNIVGNKNLEVRTLRNKPKKELKKSHQSFNEEITEGINEKPTVKHPKVRWTPEQKGLTITYFQNNIKNKKPPTESEVEEFRQKNSIMANKDWKKIKVFIFNEYNKKK